MKCETDPWYGLVLGWISLVWVGVVQCSVWEVIVRE